MSMWMLVFLFIVPRMLVLMGAMFPGMIMIMDLDISSVLMVVSMRMRVLMGVGVTVLVGVSLMAVPVLMAVLMGVSVGMLVLVFMLAFHNSPFRLFSRRSQKMKVTESRVKLPSPNPSPPPGEAWFIKPKASDRAPTWVGEEDGGEGPGVYILILSHSFSP